MAERDLPPALTAQAIIGRLERAPFSGWHVRVRLVVGTATFFNAFDLLAIAYALPLLTEDWNLSRSQAGLLLSAVFAGEILGAIVFGTIAERFGRRSALIGCTALYSTMSLAAALAPDYAWLVAARVLTGMGLGAEVPIAVTYISEIAKAKGRGRFVLLYELVFPLGLLAAGAVGWWFILSFGWRPLLAIGALPALLILPMQRLLPESPRWLVHRGRLVEADAVVRRIEASHAGPPAEVPTHDTITVTPMNADSANWKDVFGPHYRRRTATLWTMYFCCFFMNYGLVTWLPTLYRSLYQVPLADSLRYAMITQVAGLAGTFTAALFIDCVSRRVWFCTAFLLACAAFLNLGFNGRSDVGMLLIGSCVAFYFVSAISIGMILYAPELYPTRIRVLGVSLGYAISILAGISAPPIVGSLVDRAGLQVVFGIFAALGAAAGCVCLLFATETRNRTLEDISR